MIGLEHGKPTEYPCLRTKHPTDPQQPTQGNYPPQQGYYAPQPGGYPPTEQPVKKSHTLRNVLIAVFLVFILFIGGCMALIGGAAKEIDKAIDEVKSQDAQPGGPDNPMDDQGRRGVRGLGVQLPAGLVGPHRRTRRS